MLTPSDQLQDERYLHPPPPYKLLLAPLHMWWPQGGSGIRLIRWPTCCHSCKPYTQHLHSLQMLGVDQGDQGSGMLMQCSQARCLDVQRFIKRKAKVKAAKAVHSPEKGFALLTPPTCSAYQGSFRSCWLSNATPLLS
jgi:hypothetical protein